MFWIIYRFNSSKSSWLNAWPPWSCWVEGGWEPRWRGRLSGTEMVGVRGAGSPGGDKGGGLGLVCGAERAQQGTPSESCPTSPPRVWARRRGSPGAFRGGYEAEMLPVAPEEAPKEPRGSSRGSQAAVRQDVLLPKPEPRQGEKHLIERQIVGRGRAAGAPQSALRELSSPIIPALWKVPGTVCPVASADRHPQDHTEVTISSLDLHRPQPGTETPDKWTDAQELGLKGPTCTGQHTTHAPQSPRTASGSFLTWPGLCIKDWHTRRTPPATPRGSQGHRRSRDWARDMVQSALSLRGASGPAGETAGGWLAGAETRRSHGCVGLTEGAVVSRG
ncbi:unnamed protein product [Nyctereutes procyonoides]|uniref:(raccoon dog) hypothetical protein n=1 Tax=Nyctereutes procyonoides TaxID=34880 RepID=A0A811YGJ9_NYCPR|nr:unnamed protein product [Nyctereutes procyonoides]